MSLYPGVPQFVHNHIQNYKYWYEQQPYTAFDAGLVPGEEEIFEIQNLPADVGPKMAIMGNVAASPTANLVVRVEGPVTVQNQSTLSFPSGLVPVMDGPDDGERSTSKIALKWLNNTGAVIDNTQVNYTGALKQLTTADKVMRGLPMDATDLRLQKKYQIYNQGLRPITIDEMKDRIWRRAILDEDFFTAAVNVGTTITYVPQFVVPSGTAFVLHRLAAVIPSASIGNMVSLSITRDTQQNHVEVLLDNAPGLNVPWPLWVTAKDSFQISYVAQAATNNVALRLSWYRVKITGLLSVVLGQTDPTELKGEEKELYDRVRAGVIA